MNTFDMENAPLVMTKAPTTTIALGKRLNAINGTAIIEKAAPLTPESGMRGARSATAAPINPPTAPIARNTPKAAYESPRSSTTRNATNANHAPSIAASNALNHVMVRSSGEALIAETRRWQTPNNHATPLAHYSPS